MTTVQDYNKEIHEFSLREELNNAMNSFATQMNPQLKENQGFYFQPMQMVALVYITRALIYIGDSIIFLAITIRNK